MAILTIILIAAFLALVYALVNEFLLGNQQWTEITKYVCFGVIVTCLVILYIIKNIQL